MVEVPGDTHTITCTRLTLRDGNHLFLRTKWFSTSFFVTALDFPKSWSYNATRQEIERRAQICGVTCEDILLQSRFYLSEYGVSESEYSFEQTIFRQPNRMRLSWTTTDIRFNEERRMSLILLRDNITAEIVPEFLNALMNTTLVVQDEARRNINKYEKVRQLAIRCPAPEKVRKRSLSQQAPAREVIRGGLDELVVKSESPGSTPEFNCSTVSYGPASGLSTPAHPPILTALDGRPQHELRTPTLQSVSSSKLLNLGMYNAGRRVSEQETLHMYGHQNYLCFDRPHALGKYVGAHGQLNSMPSEHQTISESRREHAQPRNEAVQVPMTDDHDFFLDRVGSSKSKLPVKLPVKVDVYDGMDIGLRKHSQEFTTRLSRPSMFHDVAVHKTLHRSPTCDKGVMSFESRELGMESLDGSGWINPRKSSTGVESSTFGIASQGREDIIMLSDNDEETYHNDEMGAGVMNGDDVPASERYWMTREENIGWQSRSRKRKETDDAHDLRTDPRNRNTLNEQVCVSAATATFIEVESEQHANTFKYVSRAHWKPVYHTADNRNEKLTSTFNHFNHDSRAQWNSWISEAKTEVDPWEARTQNRDSTMGRSCHIEDVVNTSSPKDLEDVHAPPSPKKLDKNSDVDFPQSDSEHLQSPTDIQDFSIPPSEGNSVKDRQVDEERNLSEQPERSYTREMGKSKNWIASDDPQSEKVKVERDVSQVSNVIGVTICNNGWTQSDIDPRNTSSHRFLREARPVGRPKHTNSYGHAPAGDYVVKEHLVDMDQDLQISVPDSDYYCFEGDRCKEKIKPNQVWALYDDVDTMPRKLIRVKEVSSNGSFWVKAIWLQPHNWSKKSERQKKTGFPVSCGDFEEPKERTVIRALNCFSHNMEFTPKTDTVIHVYPRKGEIWALYHKEETGEVFKRARSEKDRKGKGSDNKKYQFRLVVIVSNFREAREAEILVLRKRTGFRTLWEPGYKKASLPAGYMAYFSHRVPAYKLTEKDCGDLNNLDIWDIDAAAVPSCQSMIT